MTPADPTMTPAPGQDGPAPETGPRPPAQETIQEETRHVLAIAGRDLVEFLRDRRTVFITLLLPMLMYPIVAVSSAVGVRSAVSDAERQREPVPVRLALSGSGAEAFAGRLRALEGSAERKGWPASLAIDIVPPAEAALRLERSAADFWLDVPTGFLEALDGTGTAKLEARVGGWRPADQRTRDQFGAVIDSLAAEATRERLTRAGLPGTAIDPVRLAFRDAQGMPTRMGRQSVPSVIAAILILLSVLTLTGAFYPAVDAIAGEKERGTIETLLIAPCQAWEIAAGKFWAILVVTMVTLLSNVLSIAATAWVAVRFVPKELEIFPRQTVTGFAIAVAAFLALSAVGAALCLAVTAASRSTKEAQHSLTPVIVAVSLLSGFAIAPGITPFGPLAAVPFAGQVLVAREALAPTAGGSAAALVVPLVVTILSAAACAVVLLWITGTLLTDEEVLFRGPDAAEGLFKRPPARRLPTPVQGVLPVVVGLAALWYGQAFTPDDLLLTIPLQQAASVVLPLAAMLWWQRVDRSRTLRLAAPAKGWWRSLGVLLGAGLVGVGLFTLAAILLARLVGPNPSEEARALSAKIAEVVNGRPTWLVWIVIAAVPAVCEELLFRGWVLSGLAGRRGDRTRGVAAVVAQALLFAVMHLLPERMPGTFFMGLATGWLALRTGSLLAGIVCHAANNSMPILLLKQATDRPEALLDPAWVPVAALAAVLAGGLLVAANTTRIRQTADGESAQPA